MGVSPEDVRAVARLARLRLDEAEVERFARQLDTILAHMEALRELDVDAAEPIAGAADWRAPLRPDEVSRDRLERPLTELAPACEEGFFTVPRLAALDADALEEPFEDKARAEQTGRQEPEDAGESVP